MDFETGKGTEGRPTEAAVGPVRAPRTGEFEISDPIRSFGRVVYDTIFEPRTFFRGLRSAGDWLNSFLFMMICAVLPVPFITLVYFVSIVTFYTDGVGAGLSLLELAFTVILLPIYAVLSLLLGAGVAHLLLLSRAMSYGVADFKTTLRAQAYSLSLALLVSWVPAVNVVAGLYTAVYLYAVALSEMHGTAFGKALRVTVSSAIVVACPFVLVSLLLYLGPTPSFVFWGLAYLLLLVWAVFGPWVLIVCWAAAVYFIGFNSVPVIILGLLIIPLAFFFRMAWD